MQKKKKKHAGKADDANIKGKGNIHFNAFLSKLMAENDKFSKMKSSLISSATFFNEAAVVE